MLKTDDLLFNHHRDTEGRIGKLYVMCGSKPQEVPELHAGDIGALAKLSGANDNRFPVYKSQSDTLYPDKYFRAIYRHEV